MSNGQTGLRFPDDIFCHELSCLVLDLDETLPNENRTHDIHPIRSDSNGGDLSTRTIFFCSKTFCPKTLLFEIELERKSRPTPYEDFVYAKHSFYPSKVFILN